MGLISDAIEGIVILAILCAMYGVGGGVIRAAGDGTVEVKIMSYQKLTKELE